MLLLIFIVMVAGMGQVKGQYAKVRAEYVGPYPANTGGTNGAAGTAGIGGGQGALGTHSTSTPADLNDTNYATNFAAVKAASGTNGTGIGAGAGKSSTSYLTLNFTGTILPKIGDQVFLKISPSNSVVLVGADPKSQVTIQGFNGATSAGSALALSTLATNADGYYVFPVTADFTSIKILVTTGDTGLATGNPATTQADVYDVYMFDPTCNPAKSTAISFTGVSLLSSINNPDNAIDGNLSTYSSFNAGIGLGATLIESINLYHLSKVGEAATVTLSVPQALVAVGLLGNLQIEAFNGATSVGAISVSALLQGTDLLGLLQSGKISTLTFLPPGGQFDRINVSMGSLLNVSGSLNLYEVQITPAKPTFIAPSLQNITICSGNTATFTPNAPASGNELRWYKNATGGTWVPGNSYTTANLTAPDTIYVAQAIIGCAGESERVPATVVVNTITPGSIAAGQTICSGTKPAAFTGVVATATAIGAVITYQWQKSSNDNTHYANISGATAPTFTESANLSQNTYYKRIATTTLNGVSCTANSNEILISLHPKPPTPFVSIN
jgi:hypothetical protein